MGKRSSFDRIPRDFYPTPYEAVIPLLPHLPPQCEFIEHCAGDGRLIEHLERHGHTCMFAYDIEPGAEYVHPGDARFTSENRADFHITNPPWDRAILHLIIANLSSLLPTWLLFDADWMHTRQSAELMKYCRKIVSVGRVKWIPDSTMTGKDNCAWYLFDQSSDAPTQFIGRQAQAIEAQRAATTKIGAVHESAVPKGCAQRRAA
jgi:hypothetical protein